MLAMEKSVVRQYFDRDLDLCSFSDIYICIFVINSNDPFKFKWIYDIKHNMGAYIYM